MASEASGALPGVVAAVLAAAVAWAWLDGRGRSGRGAAPSIDEEGSVAEQPVPIAPTGNIRGRVRWRGGTPPAFDREHLPCAACRAAAPISESCWELSPDSGLSQALLWVTATPGDASDPPRDATILLRPCEFDPQVVALRLGAALVVRSEDPAIHFCVMARPTRNHQLRTWRDRGGEERYEPTKRELWIPLDRDCHSYTSAWVTVFGAERFDITTADGDFEISGLVPGRRKLHIRHPLLGRERCEFDVDVSSTEVTTFDLTLP